MKIMLKTSAYPSLLCSKPKNIMVLIPEKFAATFLIQKSDTKTVASVEQAYQTVLVEKYGQGKIPKRFQNSAC